MLSCLEAGGLRWMDLEVFSLNLAPSHLCFCPCLTLELSHRRKWKGWRRTSVTVAFSHLSAAAFTLLLSATLACAQQQTLH